MEPAIGQSVEERGELAGGARRLDALAGGVLGQPRLAHAVRVHGGVGGPQVEPPRVDFREVGQQRGRHASNNVAKSELIPDTVIPRTRLRARYGQGWLPG